MAHKILLVDDLKSIYNAICKTLCARGCEIDYCATGKEGVQSAIDNDYDLVILDIHLPDISGIEICQTLKRRAFYKLRPIVLLTSDTRSLERGLKAGASDYILKPFNELEMIARIFTQLNLSKERIETERLNQSLVQDLNTEKGRSKYVENELFQYFYQTAHKMRSPITSLDGLLQLLKIEFPDNLNNKYLNMMEKNLERLYYVNQQVATIGTIRNQILIEKVFNLRYSIIKYINTNYSPELFDIDIDEKVNLYTDEEIFMEGLKPVLDNALYFSSSNSSPRKIKVNIEKQNQKTLLTVTDEGTGIQADQIDKIYDMFFIGTDDSEGNGLGLYISNMAFEKLNTSILIESKEKNYTKVIMDLSSIISSFRLNSYQSNSHYDSYQHQRN